MPFNTAKIAGLRLTPGLLAVAAVVLMLLAGIALPARAGEHLAERAGDRGLGLSTANIILSIVRTVRRFISMRFPS